MKELLKKLEYNKCTDHLVFTGDVITKGPDSLRVVDFARRHGASCVRGNQDDRILLHRSTLATSPSSEAGKADKAQGDGGRAEAEEPEGKAELSELLGQKVRGEKKLARRMTDEQAAWLNSCPLMLRARDVNGLGDVVVVHAGLVQGVALEQQVGFFFLSLLGLGTAHGLIRMQLQDPFALMNMRTIHAKMRVPSANTNGMHWARLWNKLEARRRKPITVMYAAHPPVLPIPPIPPIPPRSRLPG